VGGNVGAWRCLDEPREKKKRERAVEKKRVPPKQQVFTRKRIVKGQEKKGEMK